MKGGFEARPTRRNVLEGVGATAVTSAAALGAISGGAVEAALDDDWENLKTAAEKIDHFRTKKGGFDNDTAFHENAQTETIEGAGLNRAEYIWTLFSTKEARNMPPEIQSRLADIAPGIAAQESRFNNNVKASSAGARYIWQLTAGAVKDTNDHTGSSHTFEDTKKLTVATEVAFNYFDHTIYQVIEPVATKCIEQFGLHESEGANFMVLCMVNAYNTGPGRMRGVLTNFMQSNLGALGRSEAIAHLVRGAAIEQTYQEILDWAERNGLDWARTLDANDVYEAYSGTGVSLFNALSERAYRDGYDPKYRKDSSEYTFKVLAGAESLAEEYTLPDERSAEERGHDTMDQNLRWLRETFGEPVIAGAGGALAARMMLKRFIGPYTYRKDIEAQDLDELVGNINRRQLLFGVAGIAGSAAVATDAALPSLSMPSWWRGEGPIAEKMTEFPDGTIMAPKNTSRIFEEFRENGGALFESVSSGQVKTDYILQMQSMDNPEYRGNYTNSGLKALVSRWRSDGTLRTFTSEDDLVDAEAATRLERVDPINARWRCRGVGMGNVSAYEAANNSNYLALMPHTKAELESIADEFQTALKTAGLHEDWRMRLNITSLTRTGADKIDMSSTLSSHENGIAFDIGYHFDLIHDYNSIIPFRSSEEYFKQLNPTRASTPEESALITATYLLHKILKRKHDEGRILLTLEGNTPYYNTPAGITDYRPLDNYRRSFPHMHIAVPLPENL